MKKGNNKTTLLIAIALMILLVIISLAWILHIGNQRNIARSKEEAAQAQQEAQQKAEEEEAAREEQAAEITGPASHVYSNRGTAGPEEHSFKAYDAAIEAGSRYLGIDVVVSSDRVLYVSYEQNAVAMTGYNGMYEYLSSETIDGLTTEAGNKVLRLSEVFDKYGKDVNYVIILRPNSDACIETFEKLVDEYGFEDVITVGSLYPEVVETLENKYPDMPKIYECWSQADFGYVVDKPYVDIISVKVSAVLMTESNCSTAHENGKLFSAWTLDTEDDIKYAINMGVDTYFTNDTPLALSLEKEYREN